MRPPETALPFPPPVAPVEIDGARPLGWESRWSELARAVGLAADEPVCVALSGGADSVFLLHVIAAARPRPRVWAVHVEHALRGASSRAEAAFCVELARSLDVPLVRERAPLDAQAGDLEQRARVARYRALCRAAERCDVRTLVTGHHADDSLESLLLRWMRGGDVAAFGGVPLRTQLGARGALNPTEREVLVARPLFALRREEVRATLARSGLAWREDESNQSSRFARNRVRHALLPALRATCGAEVDDHLRAFATAVEELERHCARWTAGLHWQAPLLASARRGAGRVTLGGSLPRAELEALVAPLRRRALWRLILEGTGRAPKATQLSRALDVLEQRAHGEITLAGGWRLSLRHHWLHLDPPSAPAQRETSARREATQLWLPFDACGAPAAEPADEWSLRLPGGVALPDGRSVLAELIDVPAGSDVPRSSDCVELDADGLDAPLSVRWPRAGERFHALGAPGARPLGRFLRDAGIPRHEREHVALVCAGAEILWVAGVRPGERRRVSPRTQRRLRLRLRHSDRSPSVARR